MSKAQTGSAGRYHLRRFKTFSLVIAASVLAGCVANEVTPDISALSPDLERQQQSAQNTDLVSSDKKAVVASAEIKPAAKTEKPVSYQFVTKANYGLPALNQEFPSTFGFSGNNIDHLLLGGGSSWQSPLTKNAGQVTTPLVLSAGRLFFGDERGGIHAIAASNGAPLWTVKLSNDKTKQSIATLFADKNVLYAATDNGNVIAISAKNGAIGWKKKITGSVNGALRSLGDALLLQIDNNQLITLSKDKAVAGWRYQSSNSIKAVAVANGTIQMLNNKNEFLHLDAKTGKQRTKNEFSNLTGVSQLISTTDDLIVSGKSGLSRYTPSRSKRLWRQKDGVEGRVIASGEAIFSTGKDNVLRAYKRADGKLNWLSKLPENTTENRAIRWSRPILAGGRLHLASNTGYVASFNADDGKLVLLRNIKAPINSAPIVASGRLYIVAANGRVYRL